MFFEELINSANAEFGLSHKLLSYNIISRKPTRIPLINKYIARVVLQNRDSYILKLYPSQTNSEQILYERRCLFAECLLSNKILTTRPQKNNQSYTRQFQYAGQQWIALIEEDFGVDLVYISLDDPKWVQLLAKTHAVSKHTCFRIGQSSSWYNIFSKNEIVRYDKFALIALELADTKYKNQANYILSEGGALVKKALTSLSKFDEYATQGDFSPFNLFWHDNNLVIMDYDEAGDCALLSDLVLQCYYHAKGILHINSKEELDSYMMLSEKEYTSIMPLCAEEEELYWDLYQLAQIFDYREMQLLSSSIKSSSVLAKNIEIILNTMEANIREISPR